MMELQHATELASILGFLCVFLWSEYKWIVALVSASFLLLDVCFPAGGRPPRRGTTTAASRRTQDETPSKTQPGGGVDDAWKHRLTEKRLTREHIDPIASRKWKTVLAWITFSPDELLLVDKNESTMLHHACLFRAPADVIAMALYAVPELASIKNEDGEIPLHWAIRLSAPKEVFKMLLAASPASGVHARDNNGNTALSLLWDRHRVDILNTWWNEGKEKLLLLASWKRLLFLLQSSQAEAPFLESRHCEPESSLPFRPLHVAAQSPLPPGFFSLLIKIYRGDLDVKDEQGRLPLHVAATNAETNRSHDVQSKLSLLLDANKTAADTPDGTGRLPIYTALEAGVGWDEGIQEFFAMDPKVVSTRDSSKTKLYPFMLAAVGALPVCDNVPSRSNDTKNETKPPPDHALSTIYNLLRADPERVRVHQN